MRWSAGEWIFRQMQTQISKVYWRYIEEYACRRWRKRLRPTRRQLVRCCLKRLCRARRRSPGARGSGGSALGFLPFPWTRETTRRGRAGLRRFRIGASSGSFAARGGATQTRGAPAVPHWGFFQFLCRARWRDADARVSGGFALAVSRNFAARSDANARVSGGFALAILPALLAHETRRFHVRKVIPALSRTRRCGRGRG